MTELFIEFDGQQLEVLTDIPAMRSFFERTYGPMLVSGSTASAGRLEVLRNGKGCVIRGIDSFETDEERPLESFIDFLRHEVLFHFIKARPDLLWIHAAAVERDGLALLIVGSSGQGKSTLSTRLCETGWRLLSDDAAPLRMDSNEVIPFQQSPHRRKPSGRQVRPGNVGMFEKEEVVIPPSSLGREAAVIRAIVFPLFTYGAPAGLSLLPPGEAALELLRNSTNFADHKEEAVNRAASLARVVPMYRLAYGDWQSAVPLLETLH